MSNGFVKPLLRSLLFSYIATGILLFALAFGLYKLHFRPAQVSAAVNIIYAVTCFFGGFLAGKALRQRRFFWGLLTGLFYFLILFLMSAAMDKGITADMKQIMSVLGICAASGTIGGMAS
ncbi:MAG: TIGR04086 family membrane protein [Lachnospiraceae bacterium]